MINFYRCHKGYQEERGTILSASKRDEIKKKKVLFSPRKISVVTFINYGEVSSRKYQKLLALSSSSCLSHPGTNSISVYALVGKSLLHLSSVQSNSL